MFERAGRAAFPFLIAAMLFSTGCRKRFTASSADPEKARATLRQGLDAWKKGETPEAIRASASINFSDSEWSDGLKLVGYEVQGDGNYEGFDWQCKVTLSLEDARGNKSERRAVYSVSTSPKLVVVRKEM